MGSASQSKPDIYRQYFENKYYYPMHHSNPCSVSVKR